jgi:hypothetical protein
VTVLPLLTHKVTSASGHAAHANAGSCKHQRTKREHTSFVMPPHTHTSSNQGYFLGGRAKFEVLGGGAVLHTVLLDCMNPHNPCTTRNSRHRNDSMRPHAHCRTHAHHRTYKCEPVTASLHRTLWPHVETHVAAAAIACRAPKHNKHGFIWANNKNTHSSRQVSTGPSASTSTHL